MKISTYRQAMVTEHNLPDALRMLDYLDPGAVVRFTYRHDGSVVAVVGHDGYAKVAGKEGPVALETLATLAATAHVLYEPM